MTDSRQENHTPNISGGLRSIGDIDPVVCDPAGKIPATQLVQS